MDILQIIILGIVQAVTEWLPLSSKTMDTVVYTQFFGGSMENVVGVLLFLHLGTLLAAAAYFRNEIMQVAKSFLRSPADWERHKGTEAGFLIVALAMTGVVGVPILAIEVFLLPGLDASALFMLMGAGLVATGFLLSSQRKNRFRAASSASAKDGILTGALQGLSVIPGVSRAGCTTTALIFRGFDAESAFHLSFLLSIPTVLVAELVLWAYQLASGSVGNLPLQEGLLLAASSFFFGYLTIGALLKFAKDINVSSLAFLFGIMMLAFGLFGIG